MGFEPWKYGIIKWDFTLVSMGFFFNLHMFFVDSRILQRQVLRNRPAGPTKLTEHVGLPRPVVARNMWVTQKW